MAFATAIAAVSTLAATTGGGPVTAVGPEDDVAEWFDEVDPAMVVDNSADCMTGTPDNRVLPRRPHRDAAHDGDVRRRCEGRRRQRLERNVRHPDE